MKRALKQVVFNSVLTAVLLNLAPDAGATDLGWSRVFASSSSPLQIRAVRDWTRTNMDDILAQDGYNWTILDAQNKVKWQFGSQINTNLVHLFGPYNIERVDTNSSDFSDINGDGKRDLLFACVSSSTSTANSIRLYDANSKKLIWERAIQQPIQAVISGKMDNQKRLSVVVRSADVDQTGSSYTSRKLTVLDGATGKITGTLDLGPGGLFAIALDDWDHQGLMKIRVQDQNKTTLYAFDGQTLTPRWAIPLNIPAGWSFATMVNRSPTGSADYTISDVDGDGSPDLLVTARPTNGASATMIQLYGVPSGTLKWSDTNSGSVNIKLINAAANSPQQIVVNTYSGSVTNATSNNVLSVLSGVDGTAKWSTNLGSSFPGTLVIDPNKDGRYQIAAPVSNSICYFNADDGSVARQFSLTPPDSSAQTWTLISFGPTFQYAWSGDSQFVDINNDGDTELAVAWLGSSAAYCVQVYDIAAGEITSQFQTPNNQDATQFNNNRLWLNPDPVVKQAYATQSYSYSGYYYNRAVNLFDPSVSPQIITAPQDQTARAGSNFVLSAIATGTRPLQFQWFFKGHKLAGATNAALTLRNAQPSSTGYYTLNVSNRAGLQTRTATLTIIPTNPPVVTITGQSVAGASCVLSGKASDVGNVSGVSQVLGSVNGSDFTPALGTGSWTFYATLQPGSNIVAIKAADFNGNESVPVKHSVFYTVKVPITLTTNGPGKIAPVGFTGTNLAVGQRYTVTATPTGRQPFIGWSGGIVATNPSLSFIMVSNLSLTANFGTNPFAAAQGIYSGLFFETNQARQQSSGSVTVNITGNGGFSGAIINGLGRTPLSGLFDVNGRAAVVATNSHVSLTNTLSLDFNAMALNGTVSSTSWTSVLQAYPATANSAFSGKYTLAILPPQDTNAPAGAGYATATVDAKGSVTMAGHVADGASISQQTTVSRQGYWPFYASLYSGGGSVLGWLQFTNAQKLGNPLVWICPANASLSAYSAGFTNTFDAIGSRFTNSSGLGLSAGALTLAGGDLSISSPFTITNNVFQFDSTNTLQGFQFSINATNGLVTGSFTNTDNGAAVAIQGVILQNQTNACGYFLSTNASGLFQIKP